MNTQNGRSALIRSAFIVLVALMGMVTVLPEDALAQFSGWIRCSLGSRDVCFTDGNVGIGTTNPLAPLSISNGLGDKISLWDSGSIDRMHGFGIKDSTLAFVMPNPESHPHFGAFMQGKVEQIQESLILTPLGKLTFQVMSVLAMKIQIQN